MTLKKILKNTILCIKYPFLYPRNAWTDKYTPYLFRDTLTKLRFKSMKSIFVTGKIVDSPTKNNLLLSKQLGKVSVKLESNILYITYKKNTQEVNIQQVIRPFNKFEVYGVDIIDEKASISPLIIVYAKPLEENKRYFPVIELNFLDSKFYNVLYSCLSWFTYHVLNKLFILPTYTWWDSVPKGWRKAFGNEYLEELKKQLIKDKMLYKWRILQIKEKWGTLRLYCNYGSQGLYDIIQKYEDLSLDTCIECGKPATKLTGGWICPYCDDCFPQEIAYMEKVNGEYQITDEYKK